MGGGYPLFPAPGFLFWLLLEMRGRHGKERNPLGSPKNCICAAVSLPVPSVLHVISPREMT